MLNRLRDRVPTAVWPAAIFGIAALWVAYWGLQVHALAIFDERLAVEGGRWLQANPGTVFDLGGYWPRGVERMTAILWWPFTGLESGARQFELSHILYALIYAAVAFPAWALLRGLGLAVGWAALGTAVCLFVPWAVFATLFLNSAIATTLVLVILWIGWRSALRPDWRWDLLALALLAALAVTRVSYAAFGAVWVVGLAVPSIRAAVHAGGWRAAPRGVVSAARAHPLSALVSVLGLFAAAALVLSGVGGVAGGDYGARPLNWHSFSEHVTISAAQLAAATAIVPLIVGGAWMCRTSVCAEDDGPAVFAVVGLTSMLILMLVNTAGGFDERYLSPAIVIVLIAFFAALGRREFSPLATGVIAVGVWWAMSQHAIAVPGDAEAIFYAPGQQFFSRIVIDGFAGKVLSDPVAVLGCVVVATAVAAGLAFSARVPTTAVAVAAMVAVYCLVGSAYVMRHFTDGQRPGATFADMTFVDSQTRGAVARPFSQTSNPDVGGLLFDELRYFNADAGSTLTVAAPLQQCCSGSRPLNERIRIDPATGAVTPVTALTPYVVTSTRFVSAGLATRTVSTSDVYDLTLFLDRVLAPRATYLALDDATAGRVGRGQSLRLRVFARGARAVTPDLGCLIADVTVAGGALPQRQIRLAPLLGGRSSAIVTFRGPARLGRTVVGPCS